MVDMQPDEGFMTSVLSKSDGEFKGFAVMYNSDNHLTPNLGPSEGIFPLGETVEGVTLSNNN